MIEQRSYFSASLSFTLRRSFTGAVPLPLPYPFLPQYPLRGTFHHSFYSPGTFAPSLHSRALLLSTFVFWGPALPSFPSLSLFGSHPFPFPLLGTVPPLLWFLGYVPSLPLFAFLVRISFFLSEYPPFLCQDANVSVLSLSHATLPKKNLYLRSFTHIRALFFIRSFYPFLSTVSFSVSCASFYLLYPVPLNPFLCRFYFSLFFPCTI